MMMMNVPAFYIVGVLDITADSCSVLFVLGEVVVIKL